MPNIEILKFAQIKGYIPVQKHTWDKIASMKQGYGEQNIHQIGNIILLIAVKNHLTF